MLKNFRPDALNTEGKLSLVTTNQSEPQVKPKKALFSLKKALKLSSSGLATQICRLRKINQVAVKTSALDTLVIPQKINLAPVTGPAKPGDEEMKTEELLSRLEKHEAECNLRYKRIDERLQEHHAFLKLLDGKLWALGVLVILAPLIHRLWE